MINCKDFLIHLMDTISKQKNYKSKIPEILSYLDSESEMAKSIFDLAIENGIYKKESLKEEVLKVAEPLANFVKEPAVLVVELEMFLLVRLSALKVTVLLDWLTPIESMFLTLDKVNKSVSVTGAV